MIGTGASAIQFVPADPAARSSALHLFQRTAPWVMPRRRSPDHADRARPLPPLPGRCSARCAAAIYWARELFAIPMLRVAFAPAAAAGRPAPPERAQVADPELRAKLTPDYLPGCKRILVANDYLPSLAEPNVELVCEAIAEVRGRTVVGADGSRARGRHDHPRDRLSRHSTCRSPSGSSTAAGGRWPSTGTAARRRIAGRWSPGFPNLFFLLGPEHRARAQLGRLHGRGPGRLRDRGRSTTCAPAGSRRVEVDGRGAARLERRDPARG